MPQAFIKFYGNDWRSDPKLRLCSAAARGVWIDCITLMMEAEPFGHLLIEGQPAGMEEISALTNTPLAVVKKAMEELGKRNVYSVTEEGIIYSRRMVKDYARSVAGKSWGKEGGNPALKKQGITGGVKGRDKAGSYGDEISGRDNTSRAGARAPSQKPEARNPPYPPQISETGFVPVGCIPWTKDGVMPEGSPPGADIVWSYHKLVEEFWGADPPPWLTPKDVSIAQGWVERGAEYEPVRALMEERLRAMCEAKKSPPPLRYFDQPVAQMAGRAA